MVNNLSNEEIVSKALETGLLQYGGRLQAAQQDEFVEIVRDTSVMLSAVRFIQMRNPRVLIDKLYVGEPITKGAVEKTNDPVDAGAVADQIELIATKARSDWSISTELLQENIEGADFEDTIMEMFSKRISTDIEILGIQGDTSIPAGTPLANLRRITDGWDKRTQSANILDANGAGLDPALLANATRYMPENYLQDPNLHWIVPRALAIDWQEQIAGRATVGGDRALSGQTMTPYGFPMLVVPNIPSRNAITETGASPAILTAGELGPYTIVTGTNDVLEIDVDAINVGVFSITLPAGVYTPVELAAEIKRQLIAGGGNGPALAAALKLYDNGIGGLVFETVSTGAASAILIGAGSTLNLELDLDDIDGTNIATSGLPYTATGAASGGESNDGTFLWLANPKNFIFGMLDDTRVYTEYNKELDCLETVVYNHVGFQVENTEAIVKVINIKRG